MINRRKTAGIYTHKGSFLNGLKQIVPVCFAFLLSVFSTNLLAVTQNPNIPANANSASCNNATLETYSGTSNLQANWQSNPIRLTWFSDNTQLTNVQSAANGCNYDGGLTVPSTPPTKTGYTFNGWKVRGLPDGYTRLQYIQSSGTQWIDTGFYATEKSGAYIKYKYHTLSSSAYGRVFGNRVANQNKWFTFISTSTGTTVSTTSLYLQNGSTSSNYISKNIDSNAHEVSVNVDGSGKLYFDGVLVGNTSSASAFTMSESTRIFSAYNNSSYSNATAQVFRAIIFENGVLKKDFIPAKRNSDNAIGMFDTVSQTFFANGGSGTFTAGPVVQ